MELAKFYGVAQGPHSSGPSAVLVGNVYLGRGLKHFGAEGFNRVTPCGAARRFCRGRWNYWLAVVTPDAFTRIGRLLRVADL